MNLDDFLKQLGIGQPKETEPESKSKTQSDSVTVCVKCAYFINLEPNSPRRDIWYNHLCKANKLTTQIDPYDGKEKPCSTNSLGQGYFSEHPYKYCRDCNDGNCPDFARKK